MFSKTVSLTLAAAALAGAVIYAQNQAEKGKKGKQVFDTSKSGTPTPIEEAPPAPGVTPPMPAQTNQPVNQTGEQKKKKEDMTIMPSSKSMTPHPTKPKKQPPMPPT